MEGKAAGSERAGEAGAQRESAGPLKRMGKSTTIDAAKLRRFMDPNLVFAFSHEVREHVLVVLNERVASPSEIGEEIGVKVSYVSYHFAELRARGLIELVEKRRARGFWEHFYRATSFPARSGTHLSWTPMQVDEKGWEDAMAVLADSLERLLSIREESSERLARAGQEAIPAAIAMLGFETRGREL